MSSFKAPSPRYIGPPNRHGPRTNKPIRRIVIHATVSACAKDARGIANYFRRTTRPASAHYIVDAKEAIQGLYDSWVGYHAPPNEHSLGIELCCTLSNEGRGHWSRKDHRKMLRNAARLTAGLCLAYDVPVRHLSPAEARNGQAGIMGHNDVRDAWGQTTHWDPGPFFPWAEFLAMVEDEVQALRSKGGRHKKPKEPKKPKSRGPRIDEAISLLEGALGWAEDKGLEGRASRLREARSWLTKIKAR